MSFPCVTAKMMDILTCKAAITLFMCLSSVSGFLTERCMKKSPPFFSVQLAGGKEKKQKKQLPQAAYGSGLRSGELWHMRYRSRARSGAG